MSKFFRAVAALLLLSMAVLGPSGTASASCLLDERPLGERLVDTPVAFRGTVTATAHGGTTANFQVEEIWKGSPALREVIVQGGSGQDNAATSVDRSWEVGTTYLVLAQTDGERLLDNACSATQPWTEDLAAARPADATMVTDTPAAPAGGLGATELILIGLAGAAAAAGIAAWLRQRRHLEA